MNPPDMAVTSGFGRCIREAQHALNLASGRQHEGLYGSAAAKLDYAAQMINEAKSLLCHAAPHHPIQEPAGE